MYSKELKVWIWIWISHTPLVLSLSFRILKENIIETAQISTGISINGDLSSCTEDGRIINRLWNNEHISSASQEALRRMERKETNTKAPMLRAFKKEEKERKQNTKSMQSWHASMMKICPKHQDQPSQAWSFRVSNSLCSLNTRRLISKTASNPSFPRFAFWLNLSTLASSTLFLIFCHPPQSAVILASWSKSVEKGFNKDGRYTTVSRTLRTLDHVRLVEHIVSFFVVGSTYETSYTCEVASPPNSERTHLGTGWLQVIRRSVRNYTLQRELVRGPVEKSKISKRSEHRNESMKTHDSRGRIHCPW